MTQDTKRKQGNEDSSHEGSPLTVEDNGKDKSVQKESEQVRCTDFLLNRG